MTSFYEEDANCAAMTDHDLAAALEAQIPASGDVPPIATLTRHLLQAVGEDPTREGLLKTPQRVENAWRFLSQGYREDLKLIVNNALFESANDDIVLVKDIVVFSMCEHHLLPFWGRCHIAYIPNGKVIGLSKLPRIADMFGRRLQLQERLTQQIADAVDEVLKPRGVAVITECRHMCMMMRGVEKNASSTVCRSLKGVFKTDDSLRRDLGRMVEESTAV